MPTADHGVGERTRPVQSLPETVQVLRPPGTWTVPGAFARRRYRRSWAAYNAAMPDPQPPPGAERLLRWVMAGVVAWGCVHAIGAWRFNHDPRRAVVVLGCVAAFLGFWLVMLAARRRRLTP